MTFDGLKTLVDLVYEYLNSYVCVYYVSFPQNIGEVPIHFSYFLAFITFLEVRKLGLEGESTA